MRSPIVRLVRRGWTRHAFVAMAFLSLAQPFLVPLTPDLAGWAPHHDHVYAGGQPVPHTHPWDRPASEPAPADSIAVRYVFHPCEIHPDGVVPIGVAAAPVAAWMMHPHSDDRTHAPGHAPDHAHDHDADLDGVVAFLFDLDLAGSALPMADAAPLQWQSAAFKAPTSGPSAPEAFASIPSSPPPRT